ncbi:hypothetical protein [Rhizobium metallidurans]|uniref:DUF2393 domain-containing protein n=1 Tax=Rhizobium metallidurans TaxID=1265931 RepID=A0A7W6CQK2_9HYPH|nr:hypothetical protein [Rhizobium metallidurans]MBB3965372.1 hypothetical protein [Rhizobium metallidurans]
MIFLVIAVPIVVVCFLLAPRPTLIAVACMLLVGAGVGFYVYFQQTDRNSLAALVSGTSTGGQGCPDPAKSVFVTLANASDRQVNVVRFRLIAKRSGHSSEVYSDYFTTDKIIEPRSEFGNCWTLNPYRGLDTLPGKPSPADFDWSVEISSVDFAAKP